MSAPLTPLLERLRTRPPLWLDAEMLESTAEQRDAWIASGWLRALPPATHAACPRCPDGPTGSVRMVIDRSTGRTTARVACPQCGLAEVPLDSLRRWEIDIARFAADVAAALGSRSAPSPFAEERVWSLGRAAWAGRSQEFFLVSAVDSASVPLLRPVLDRHPKAVLLVPTVEEAMAGNRLGPQPVIALAEVVSVRDGGLRIDRERMEAMLQGIALDEPKTGKKPTRKRASRTAMIEKLCKELTVHLRAAKNHACDQRRRHGEPMLLPRPSKQQLAKQAGLRPDEVTRCFQDDAAHQLRVLWEMADDLDQILRFGGGKID